MMADPSARILVRVSGAISHHRFFGLELSAVRWQSTAPKGRNSIARGAAPGPARKRIESPEGATLKLNWSPIRDSRQPHRPSQFAFRGYDERPAIIARQQCIRL